ncbi:MAG: virulence factor [Geminicoccaceae bacterium]
MAELFIVSWRDIPAQVLAKAGRQSARRPLDERFQQAIDRAAMRAGLRETDAYLAEWRRLPAGTCGEDLEAAADELAARLDADYPPERLRELVASGGLSTPAQGTPA